MTQFHFKVKDGTYIRIFLYPWVLGVIIGTAFQPALRNLIRAEEVCAYVLIKDGCWALPPLPARGLAALWQKIREVKLHPHLTNYVLLSNGNGVYTVSGNYKLFRPVWN